MQLMGCINHTNTDTYVNIMMNRKEKKSPMEQKAAQVFSQQEREQQTRDLKQQDTKLNALTKEEGNVPLSGVAVRKGPKCRISTTKK